MSGEKAPTPPSAGGGGAPAGGCVAPCPTSTYGTAITIEGSDDFKKKTIEALDAIKKTPTGAKMLKSIEDSGKKLTFKESSTGNSASPIDGAKAQRKADGTPGEGSGSTVRYNPNKPQVGDGSEPWMTRPPAVGLAHELIHAYHSANGTNDFTPKGEDMAVGVPPYDTEAVTENKIRDEWTPKQPNRPHY